MKYVTPALEAWRRAGRTFDHRGHAIFYRDEGAGEALVAIHGFPSASWDWSPMWPALTARFRVLAADMIGFGFSDKPRPYPYSMMDQADLHERWLRDLGVSRFHVLAHDYGDTVAQELLARHLERGARADSTLVVRSICFLNGGLFPEMHRPRTIQKILASPLGPLVAHSMSKRAFATSLTAIFGRATPPSDALKDELWTLLRHQRGDLATPALLGYMAERRLHRERWVSALVRSDVPIRLIDGAADPVSGAHMVARFREIVPNADSVALPEIGHYPQIEDPKAVTSAFVAFHERVASLDP